MKLSEQWLREWIDPPINADQLAEQLTMAGMEVESIENLRLDFSGIVVARIESVEPHPEGGNLKVCRVNNGNNDALTIVCGAENARPELHVPLAGVGAKLPGGNTISKTVIKGVQSEGMLCSAAELGLTEDDMKLFELPEETILGDELRDILVGEDTVIEFSLTPNRGDCLSIKGIAREVSVLNQTSLKETRSKSVDIECDTKRDISIDIPEACPRYLGRVIEGVDVSVPSPLWLSEKLRCCGIRSINAVVDITNFVMLELGQPIHAFDNDKLVGEINIRYAISGEKLVLLDNQEYELTTDTLMIADEARALAMAGIMGGLDSAVINTSRNIFLETAFFNPRVILGQARQYGLHTDSSHRFERGVDYHLQHQACERATQLIIEICGGRPGPVVEESFESQIPTNPTITLCKEKVKDVLGIEIDPQKVKGILEGLAMQVEQDKDSFRVIAPSHRFDIEITADLIEEIARIYGYNKIPDQSPVSNLRFTEGGDQQQINRMRQILISSGYQEAITYSFVDEKVQKVVDPESAALHLANPISSDMTIMRTSMWPGLLQALIYNLNRQQQRIRLFETGLVYTNSGEITQEPAIGGLIYGNRYSKQWDISDTPSDFYDIKLNLEVLINCFGQKNVVKFETARHPALHQGQSAKILYENQLVGYLGVLHPKIQADLELGQPVILFELKYRRFSRKITPKYRKISKFPAVHRDLAIVVNEDIRVADILEYVGNITPDVLNNLELFDVYQGEGIDLGKKSLALGLTFSGSSSTLKDEEVEAMVGEILDKLHEKYGAMLRE